MKKLVLSLFFLMMMNNMINAQTVHKDLTLSIAADGGFTLSDYSPFSLLTYGGDVQAEYRVVPRFATTLSGGYLTLSDRYNVGLPSFIPVLAGVRYYIESNVYASLQAGTSFIIQAGSNSPFSSSIIGKGNAFTYAPGIGYRLSKKIDVLFKYQAANKNNINFSFGGLRIAYDF